MNTENSHTVTENGYDLTELLYTYDNIKISLICSYSNIKGIVIPNPYAFLSSEECWQSNSFGSH